MSYRQSPLAAGGRRSRAIAAGPLAAAVVFVVVVAVGLFLWHPWSSASGNGGGGIFSSSAPKSDPDATAQAFATAWSTHQFDDVAYVGGRSATDVASQYDAIVKELSATAVEVNANPVTPVAGNDNADQARLRVSWTLPGGQTWAYDSAVELDDVNGDWLVKWAPSIVQPSLDTGDTLRYTELDPKRATILDGAGQPLITDQPVVDIGIEPEKAGDPTLTASQIAAIVHVDAASLTARIKAAPPTQFVDVITLRQADFAPLEAAVSAVPGVILHHIDEPLSPSHDFARALLGTVGPVTKEIVDASKGRYVAGDVAGLSGLEKEFDATLAGTPGYEIDIVHPSIGGSTALPTPVATKPAVDGQPLATTLDQHVENAADSALATITDQPSALVAIRISSGQVVAVANGPDGGGYDTALLGQVPPGSAFKIVTTTALLEGGLDVNAPVPCKPSIVVQGKTFHNYEGEQLGDPPFYTDFAQSCNTAFISLSSKVPGSALPDAARALGIGACWSLGTDAFTGSVQTPATPVDLAATSFGQGSTIVSPVSLAVAVATVARGRYLAPQLVLNVASSSCAGSPSAPAPVPSAVVTQLHSLMREVVTSGTATVLKSAPGGPVMAKTGTAEYGGGDNPKTHAWLVGYQGGIAFAVYVQDGQSGGTVAAPVALKFLQDLAAT
jgi:cell division protein FtsI/penicillin-binding protein 2